MSKLPEYSPGQDRALVYSTDGSLPLPDAKCKKPAKSASRQAPPDDGVVRVGCERRNAGTMTVIYGLAPAELDGVAKELKRRCGTGGTSKGGIVELQGDHRDTVLAYLAQQERRAKRMGG